MLVGFEEDDGDFIPTMLRCCCCDFQRARDMGSSSSRLILLRRTTTSRWLSTATATVNKDREESLYSKLLALGEADANVADTLNQWVKDGKDLKRYNAISCINQLRKFGKYNHAIQLYEWLDKNKNNLNNSDRAIWIDLLAKTKGVASAEDYFNSLKETAKTMRTYGALLKCYCREHTLDKAMNLFEKMKEMSFASTSLNYNNLMSLHMKLGQPEKVPLLAQEMKEKDISFDIYTYNQLMNAYAAVNDIDAVERVVEEMEVKKFQRDWFTDGNLATIYVNTGLINKANAIIQKLEAMENLNDREAFHTLIYLYMRTSNLTGVYRSWESLKLAFSKISNTSYLIMLSALSKLGDEEGLEKLFKEWESECSFYDVRVANVVLQSFLDRNKIKEALLLSETVVKRGAVPNLKTYDLFMTYHLKNHRMDVALNYLDLAASKLHPEKSQNWFPTRESVNAFVKYFKEEKDKEGAVKFGITMKKMGRVDYKLEEITGGTR